MNGYLSLVMANAETTARNYRPVLLSAVIALYFVFLLLVNFYQVDYVLVGVFVELFTIPALLALFVYGGYNVWQGFRAEKGQRRMHWLAVAILGSCLILLGWMSL